MNTNPFNEDREKEDDKKADLTRVASTISYTEPGPIQDNNNTGPTSGEFMAILQRNSSIVEQAVKRNNAFGKNHGFISPKSPTQDVIKFTDIVDAGKPIADPDDKLDTEKSKPGLKRMFFSIV